MMYGSRKMKIRGRIKNIFCLLSAMLCLLSPVYPQSTLSTEADSNPEYLSALAQLFASANQIDPAGLQSDGPLIRIMPDGMIRVAGQGKLSPPDQALAEAGRRLFSLYQSIGGKSGPKALLLQRTKQGLFVARDGMAGRLSPSPGEAMGGALQTIASADSSLPGAARAWLPLLAGALENPGASPPRYPVARIAQNQPTLITLSGPEITRAGTDPILAGPPGSMINIIRNEGRSIQASVLFSETVQQGFSKLYLYRASDALTPVASFDVAIGAGRGGRPAAPDDDHGGVRASASPLLQPGATHSSLAGKITSADDVDMFSLRITAPGMLAVNSQGSSDVTARLMDRNGNPVASNDDSGPGYNFGMQTPVNPGNYFLSVQHCCGGGGNYRIDTQLTPR